MTLAWRRYLVPGLSTLVMLILLLGLGTWQVYRLQWKERILTRIAMAEAAPPAFLTGIPEPYSKIAVAGRFRFDRAAAFGAEVRDTPAGPTMGYHQIVPLYRVDKPPIFVDRGWVPQKRQASLDEPSGIVTVTGYIRPGETPGWFSAEDDAAARQFYTLDPQAIGVAVGVSGPEPFTLVALGSAADGSYPLSARHLPRPPNNHLSYVITWYGLAVALLVIFGVWVRKTSRE